jgi:hypothetical protein
MPRIVNKDEILAQYEKTSAIGLKIGSLLTAAHVAALGYPITALSSYDATKPAMTRLGIFIAIFGVGLLAGVINLAAVLFAKVVTYNSIHEDRDPNDEPSAGFLIVSARYSLIVSFTALLLGVLVFIIRYALY